MLELRQKFNFTQRWVTYTITVGVQCHGTQSYRHSCMSKQHNACIHNQKSDRSRFVRRDQSSPMKKNVFGSIARLNASAIITSYGVSCPMRSHQIISHNPFPTGHAYWLAMFRFFSDASEQIWIWLWMNLRRSDWSEFWLRTQSLRQCFQPSRWSGTSCNNFDCSQKLNQSNLVFVKRRLNKVLRGASYE